MKRVMVKRFFRKLNRIIMGNLFINVGLFHRRLSISIHRRTPTFPFLSYTHIPPHAFLTIQGLNSVDKVRIRNEYNRKDEYGTNVSNENGKSLIKTIFSTISTSSFRRKKKNRIKDFCGTPLPKLSF